MSLDSLIADVCILAFDASITISDLGARCRRTIGASSLRLSRADITAVVGTPGPLSRLDEATIRGNTDSHLELTDLRARGVLPALQTFQGASVSIERAVIDVDPGAAAPYAIGLTGSGAVIKDLDLRSTAKGIYLRSSDLDLERFRIHNCQIGVEETQDLLRGARRMQLTEGVFDTNTTGIVSESPDLGSEFERVFFNSNVEDISVVSVD